MTPDQMARLHAAAFAPSRGWTAAEFASLLAQPGTKALTEPQGFALVRTIAHEAELLTIAVDPAHQGRGVGRDLMARWLAMACFDTAFLEVAADNAAALALYARFGFRTVGTRRGYYARKDAPAVDALTLRRDKSG